VLEPPPASAPATSVVLVTCRDERGLIHRLTGVLLRHGANIVSNDEFVDRASQRFFMRSEFEGREAGPAIVTEIAAALPPDATVRASGPAPPRIVLMATREHHCLGELLLRHMHGELGAIVLGVVSNRSNLRELTTRFDVPFHYVPHDNLDRVEHEAAVASVLEPLEPDYLVLAKYMRILSPAFVARYPARIINIHHSFLPAFIGADPYGQAFERGVKIIGATAHFVTRDLDQGPIIAQEVIPVDHSYRPEEMAQAGRDVEKIVLAKALRLVLEHRVFVIGNRTVVFE
jgi:formyltetrahydrofolate deformylase